MLSCSGCGHGWTWPRPSTEELVRLYDDPRYYHERGMGLGRIDGADLARASELEARFGVGALLDVGCGSGSLLAAAARRGFRVVGCEVSATAAETARESFGLDIRVGGFARALFGSDERFDLITMFHVLEHVAEPREALETSRSLLTADGAICVVVPNRSSLAGRRASPLRSRIYDLPFHLHHFTAESLRRMLLAAGLENVRVTTSIPQPLDRALGLASNALRRRRKRAVVGPRDRRTETGEGGRRRPARAGSDSEGPPQQGPIGPGARLIRWARQSLPGHKLTAVGFRRDSP